MKSACRHSGFQNCGACLQLVGQLKRLGQLARLASSSSAASKSDGEVSAATSNPSGNRSGEGASGPSAAGGTAPGTTAFGAGRARRMAMQGQAPASIGEGLYKKALSCL